ncbi:hypothetical protein KAH55_00590 [bacterium]|nr:hypothetical protein [bacterium]
MVRKRLLVILLMGMLLATAGFAASPGTNRPFGQNFELFTGAGYFMPSFSQWNNAADETLTYFNENGSRGNDLSSDMLYEVGFRVPLNSLLGVELSLGYFSTNAQTVQASGQNDWGFSVNWHGNTVPATATDQIAYSFEQSVRITPVILSVIGKIPVLQQNSNLELYGGIGAGFFFSQVVTDVYADFHSDYAFLKNTSSDVSSLLANVRANANPFGMQVNLGAGYRFSYLKVNLEVGYDYAKATYEEDDWQFFTQKEMGDWDRKYSIDAATLDAYTVDKLDFSGLTVKASVGFAF